MNIFKIVYRRFTRRFLFFSGIIILAIIISIIFTGVNIGGHLAMIRSLNEILEEQIFVDITISYLITNEDKINSVIEEINGIAGVYKVEPILEFSINQTTNSEHFFFAIKDDSLFYSKLGLLPPKQYEALLVLANEFVTSKLQISNTLNIGNVTIFIKNVIIGEPKAFQYFRTGSILYYIISYDSFLKEFLQKINQFERRPVYHLNVFLDRSLVIDVSDLEKTKKILTDINSQVINIIKKYGFAHDINNRLLNTIDSISVNYTGFLLLFTFLSLPLIFVSWYLGSSLSDLIYSLNKREMSLFKIRGFSRGRLFMLYSIETIMVILLGIILGYFLSSIILSFSFRVSIYDVVKILISNQIAFIITLIFSMIISFLVFIPPLKRVLNIPILHGLYGETYEHLEKPYKKFRVWIALILGSYKLLIWILQINLNNLLSEAIKTQNFLLVIILSIALIIDTPLNILGPFLFLYGISKILSYHGSIIQEKFVSSLKFLLKDLTIISSKSISRAAARNSIIIFVISIIIFYSFFNIISLSSQEDFRIRNAYFESESDIKVYFNDTNLAEKSLNQIKTFQEIEYATLVYYASYLGYYSSYIYAINPEEYIKVAFYEESWFKPEPPLNLFKKLDENSIILDLSLANYMNLKVNNEITIPVGSYIKKFKIIGFVGKNISFSFIGPAPPIQFKSFINIASIQNFKFFFTPIILIKLKSVDYTNLVKEKIKQMKGIFRIVTFLEVYNKQRMSSIFFTEDYLNFQTLISVLLISLGIMAISIVNLFERSRIIVLQNIRGLDRNQLFKINIFAMLGIVISALIIGIITSFVTALGYVNMINTFSSFLPVEYRVIVLPHHYLYLFYIVSAVFLSLIIPIAIFIRRIQAKVEEVI